MYYKLCVCVCARTLTSLYSCLSYTARKLHLSCDVLQCHLWPVWLYCIFTHYLTNCTIFGKKVTEHKTYVLILSTTFVRNISHSKKNSVTYYLHVKNLLLLDFNKNLNIWTIFQKIISIKFHEYLSNGSCGQTDVTNLIVAFCNFAHMPKNTTIKIHLHHAFRAADNPKK